MSGPSTASVPSVLVNGGGGGAISDDDCAKIYASFTPPIEFGLYEEEEYRAKWREIANKEGKLGGWQAEHVPPCSNFHVSGRKGPTIPGCENYNTGTALTWMVHDTQIHGEEHQMITKAMRDFSYANQNAEGGPKHATLKEWMDEYEKGCKDTLKNSKDRQADPEQDLDKLCADAAKCIRQKMDAFFNENVGTAENPKPRVAQDTKLRNGQASGSAPPAPASGPSNAGAGTRGGL